MLDYDVSWALKESVSATFPHDAYCDSQITKETLFFWYCAMRGIHTAGHRQYIVCMSGPGSVATVIMNKSHKHRSLV